MAETADASPVLLFPRIVFPRCDSCSFLASSSIGAGEAWPPTNCSEASHQRLEVCWVAMVSLMSSNGSLDKVETALQLLAGQSGSSPT